MSDTEHYSSNSPPTQDCDVASLKPKILTDSENARSIQYMEKILLQRLLIRKELKIQSMLQRLEQQKLLIEEMNDKIKKAKIHETPSLWTKSVETVTETLDHCFRIIWGLLCRLTFYSSQVRSYKSLNQRAHSWFVQIMSQPLHSSMLVRSMPRVVARVGYATAEMAENWENECSEVVEEEDNAWVKQGVEKLSNIKT